MVAKGTAPSFFPGDTALVFATFRPKRKLRNCRHFSRCRARFPANADEQGETLRNEARGFSTIPPVAANGRVVHRLLFATGS